MTLSGAVPEGEYWAARAGDSPFAPGTPFRPGSMLPRAVPAWTFPTVPDEEPIPFDYTVLYRDEHLLVVDKPHFLPTTANGRIQRETLQTRLRRDLGEQVTVLHRLDRLTAGVVLCSVDPATRGRYQQLFASRRVFKRYEAHLSGPVADGEVRLPLLKRKGSRQVVVDTRGTETVTLVRNRGSVVELEPLTGFTHQLRVVANHLGAAILGDDTYPVDRGLDLRDFSSPLHLLVRELAFSDPLSGEPRAFRSLRSLPDRIE